MARFLIISRDDELRHRLALGLRARTFAVEEARGVPSLAIRPERIVVDLAQATAPGLAMVPILRELRAIWPDVPIVTMAPYPSAALMHTALRLGAVHCVMRSPDPDAVLAAFTEAEQPPDALAARHPFATLEEGRWQHIGRALETARGNISVAARLLGLHRQSLQRMLRSLRRETAAGDEDVHAA